jgi:peptidoglycan/LPS O-acetylase OafA/YrhL
MAIVFVVVYQARLFGFQLPFSIQRFGWIGVALFFVLSIYLSHKLVIHWIEGMCAAQAIPPTSISALLILFAAITLLGAILFFAVEQTIPSAASAADWDKSRSNALRRERINANGSAVMRSCPFRGRVRQ